MHVKHKNVSGRRVGIATAVALAASAVGLPGVAAADDAPAAPQITVGSADIDLYGPAGDVDVTVTDPPVGDAYLELDLMSGGNLSGLTVTDDAGTRLPITVGADGSGTVTIGKNDSDQNGIPGAPLAAAPVHLHVSAEQPISGAVYASALLFDGASGKAIARSQVGQNGTIQVNEPAFSADWSGPDGGWLQHGSPVTVATGDDHAVFGMVTTRVAKSVPVATHTRLTIPASSMAASGYTPQQIAAAVHFGYAPESSAYVPVQWTQTADGSLTATFPSRQWQDTSPAAEEHLKINADWGLPAGTVIAQLDCLGLDGKVYAAVTSTVKFTATTVPAAQRAAFYGRDSAGVLWQYKASASAAAPGTYDARARIGAGWNAYTALAPLSGLKADGTGDLVARDAAGVLWYYRGTGNPTAPFAPRTKIGAGWNEYTDLVGAGDLTGDGRADLLARDSSGVLWFYRGTNSTTAPFAPRVRVGAGWNAYTQIVGVGDMTGYGRADLLAVDHDGKLWLYRGTGNATTLYAQRVQVGTGWNIYATIVGVGDMAGDGHPDILARDSAGHLWYYRGTGTGAAPYAPRIQIGTGWDIYNTLL
jgi:Tachylectin/FG-GAP-like repeat